MLSFKKKQMKKSFIILLSSTVLFACDSATETEEVAQEETTDVVATDTDELEEEEELGLDDFIKGTWEKIAQGCDENGENCDNTKGTDWVFDGEQVTLGRVTQPYSISNDTIYIVDSPYRIAKEMGDTILFHGIKHDRFMKLVRKSNS